MRVARLHAVIARRVRRHHTCELHRPVVPAARDVRELGPLLCHRVVVDLRNRACVLHARRDEEHLPRVPDAADASVERAVVVEQVAGARVAVAPEEVPRAVEAAIPSGLGVVRCGGGDVIVQAVAAKALGERHRLARPLAARLVGARHLRVVVARAARERDLQLRAAPQAPLVPDGIREHRARDRPVAREAAGEEVRAVRVPVRCRLAEVEDDDAADAALRRAAPLPAEGRAAHGVLVERDRRARPGMRLPLGGETDRAQADCPLREQVREAAGLKRRQGEDGLRVEWRHEGTRRHHSRVECGPTRRGRLGEPDGDQPGAEGEKPEAERRHDPDRSLATRISKVFAPHLRAERSAGPGPRQSLERGSRAPGRRPGSALDCSQ